jgi:hypothetical protein
MRFYLQENIFHAIFVYTLPNLISNEAPLTTKPTPFEFIPQTSGFEKYKMKWRQMLILINIFVHLLPNLISTII